MSLNALSFALIFSLAYAKPQFVINNDANSNYFSVAMPHASMSFQRHFGGGGPQKLALQLQQNPHHEHVNGFYETPLSHTQQLQSINHAHVPAHYHVANPHLHIHQQQHQQPQPHIHHHSPPEHTHQNIIRFSPSSEVSSVTFSGNGLSYKF